MVKGNKKLLSWIVTGLFAVTTFVAPISKASTVYAKENKGNVNPSYKETAKENIENKISPKLKDQFKNKKEATFLVKLKDQVDVEKVAKESDSKAKQQKLTSAKAEIVKRSSIVSELRIKADDTQSQLKKYVENEKVKGNVKNYTSFYIVNGMSITGTESVMRTIAAMPEVESIIPNETRQLIEPAKAKNANNPSAGSIEWNIEKIGVPAVWALGIDGTGIVVASIDTGVQWDHPALKTKYRGYNQANPNTPNNEFNWFDATAAHRAIPYDDIGHGTHTMGTMVGSEENGTNKVGVAPGARWIAVKAFTTEGGSDEDLIRAGEWILAPKDNNGTPHAEKAPKVVNNSWGGGPGVDDWFRTVVRNWRAAGIFPEFSAGNTTQSNPGGPGSVANPANYPESFSTGATDINDKLASFSLRGPSPYGNILKPEISAPGVNIRSSVPGSGYEGGWNGTSMAGPHTCGLVALLLQANSSLTVPQLEEIIKNTATPRTDSQYPESPNNGYGYGIINAFNAVSSVISGLGEVKGQVLKEGEDTVPPTFNHTPVTEGFSGMEIPLTINVQDDISVNTVELQYRSSIADQWTTIATERVEGDYKAGKYSAVIPANKVRIPSLTYRWRILDFGRNEVISENYIVTINSGITVGYSTDFETKPAGWTLTGKPDWQWGTPTVGPKKAASGEKVYATNLSGTYQASSNMSLNMPPIDMPAEGPVYLQFKHWYEIENNYDKGYVKVSEDNKTWTTLKTYTNNSNNSYVSEQIDLAIYKGKRIYIQFNFTSDSSVNKQGWFIDDVKLSNVSATGSLKNRMIFSQVEDGRINTNKLNSKAITKAQAKQQPLGLPLDAKVTVVETGRSVNTNPADGSYSIKHSSGDYTLRAETYGYYSQNKAVHIVNDGVIDNQNFVLAPIPKGTITGKVINEQTGKAIKDATIYLIEDSAVAPVKTDADGNYTIAAYEGDYTVQVSAQDYYAKRFSLTIEGNKTINKDVQLTPFIGYSGEIGYDDGTAENARAFYDGGNGFAVRMSLPEGKNAATVTAGLFKFWDPEWPVPGGNSFKVAIYDATGDKGAPGKMIAGPIDATAKRDKNDWTKVDLSAAGIVVTGDFYMVYIQDKPNPNCPGIAFDEDGKNAKRTWQYVSGAFTLADEANGNAMIRAIVKYEALAPVITSPKNNYYTNNGNVTITGKASPELDLHLLNNGKEIAKGKPGADGNFSFNVNLAEGVNILKAYTSAENGKTPDSQEVKVVVDKTSPVLKITSPANNLKTNKEVLTVTGTIVDENINFIKVNGTKAKIDSNGNWSAKIILDEGINKIKVIAEDKAGNQVTKKINVDAKFEIQEITNLKPEKDVKLTSGKSVKIEFDCEPGLKKAVFLIHAPLVNNSNSITNSMGITKGDSVVEFPMMEEEDEDGNGTGHYVGYWTATSNIVMSGAQIEVKVTDWYGNTLSKRAAGKLYVNVK